jgi:hypothetical protein
MKLIGMLVLVFGLAGCGMHYSDGSRVGVVQKLSKRGFFCKTWEGAMLMAAQNVMQPETFAFSVEDESVLPALTEAMRSGKQVELVYVQKVFNPPCSPNSEYRIVGVK